jgi:hypothetical protein
VGVKKYRVSRFIEAEWTQFKLSRMFFDCRPFFFFFISGQNLDQDLKQRLDACCVESLPFGLERCAFSLLDFFFFPCF